MNEPVTKAELEEALNRLERRLMMIVGGIFVIFAVVVWISV